MLQAIVTGNVWSTKQISGVPVGAFLEVQVVDSDTTLVAFDALGSGVGERVLIAQGSVASTWFPGAPPPIDALIIGSVDPPSPKPSQPQTRNQQPQGEEPSWPATPSE